MRQALPAYPLYLVMRGVNSFAFALVLTYELAYHATVIGLSPFQLVLVGVVLESMTVLFEIPTGVFADLVSRRLSVILGIALIGAGFLIEALLPSFAMVLLAQVLWGIGFTFYSGAEAAWIVDEVGLERAQPAFLRATQLGLAMAIGGTFCGALLAALSVTVPIILGAAIFLALAGGLLLTMREAGFQPASRSSDQRMWQHMLQPIRANMRLVRVHPLLWLILLLGLVIGVSLGGFDRLYTPHLLAQLAFAAAGPLPAVTWLGIVNGVVSIMSLIGTEIIRRRAKTSDQQVIMRLLVLLYSGMVVGSFAFALAGAYLLAIAGFCLTQTLRNVSRPLLLLWVNQNAEKQIRATVISSYWQANGLGQVAGSPALGWIGTTVSLGAALGVGTALYMATIPLLLLAQRRWRRRAQQEDCDNT